MKIPHDYEFSVLLSPTEMWVVRALEVAERSEDGGRHTVSLPALGLVGTGDSADTAVEKFAMEFFQRVAKITDPQTRDEDSMVALKDFLTENGRQMSMQEILDLTLTQIRGYAPRHEVSETEVYTAAIFADIEGKVLADGIEISSPRWGFSASGGMREAAMEFLKKSGEAFGTAEKPGPQRDEFVAYVKEHGEPVPAEKLAAERKERDEFLEVAAGLTATTPDEVDGLSRESIPVLIDFWAPWCGPCRAVTPHLLSLQEEWSEKMLIRKINTDDFPDSGDRFGFRGIPTLILFKDGEEIHRVVGSRSLDALKEEFLPHV